MSIMMKRGLSAALFLGLIAASACDRSADLEVRTFSLEYLAPYQAQPLIEPYIFGDRDGAPGMASATDGAITVRETADNLGQIARVLSEYDKPRADIRLHFQLIEADGFTDGDTRIAVVELELRKIFQFRGYRLAGESFVAATDGSEFAQQMQGADDMYEIRGSVSWAGPNSIRLGEVTLFAQSRGTVLQTTVNVRPGQTLVLGSSPKGVGSTATLLLTLRAEPADGAD